MAKDATYQPAIYTAQGGDELHVSSAGRLVVDAGGSVLVNGSVPLDLSGAKSISSTGGEMFSSVSLSTATTPSYGLVSTADRSARIAWSSGSVIGIQFPTIAPIPADFSTANGLTITLLAGRASSSGSTAMNFDVQFWSGVGQSESGTVCNNITSSVPGVYQAAIPASALIAASAGGAWTVAIVPSTHDADPMHLYGARIDYTRSS